MPTARHNSISVGNSASDVAGNTNRAIQIAIDALAARRGGGEVHLSAGEFVLEDSVRLRPNIKLIGQGDRTVLRRGKLVWSELRLDADIGQKEVTVKSTDGWHEGMSLCLWDKKDGWAIARHPRIITGISGNVLHLDDLLIDERIEGGRAVNFFPMVLAERADSSGIEGFTVDAGVEDPDGVLKAMRITGIYFRRSLNPTIKHITTKNARGDGMIVGDASEGTVIEDCEACGNDYYGIHPGSHSKNCAVRRCHIHHNGADGLYICWGIKNSEFTDNDIHHNGIRLLRSGICIGHKDTDNLIARNKVYENKKYGIAFREKTEGNAAHRVTLRENTIENNGSGPEEFIEIKRNIHAWESVGCGVHVMGMTKDLVMERNIIRETRKGEQRLQRHGVYLRGGVSGVRMIDNILEGHPAAAVVDESGGKNELQTSPA